jgi:hypothetical protein
MEEVVHIPQPEVGEVRISRIVGRSGYNALVTGAGGAG